MDFSLIHQILDTRGEPDYRFRQICKFYFQKNPAEWQDFSMLSKDLRIYLQNECPLQTLSLEKLAVSQIDGTQKALLRLQRGDLVETVFIPLTESVATVCVSCQAGCGVGCTFCATGQMGFKKNLTFSEIADQIAFWNGILVGEHKKINRIVFMGMGEPMLNFDEVIKAVKFLHEKYTLEMAYRRITISSSGIIHKLYDLLRENLSGLELAISLHAPNDNLRSQIMPINKTFPLKSLMDFCRLYAEKTHQKIYFEYLMLDTVNNSIDSALELARLLKDIPRAQVNLIHYHPTGTLYKSASTEKTLAFQAVLRKAGIPAFIRKSAGLDIQAACGQLKIEY